MAYAYIIPGFRQQPTLSVYKKFGAAFSSLKFTPVFLAPTWNNRVMSDYICEMQRDLKKSTHRDVILGFSFGAYISFLLSTEVQFRHQFICSLSPYFAEDMTDIPAKWKRIIGVRRVRDFSQFRRKELSKKIHTSTSLYVGDREQTIMKRISRKVFQTISAKKTFHQLPDARHNLGDPSYYRPVIADLRQTLAS